MKTFATGMDQVDETKSDYEPIPAGDHPMFLVDYEDVETKNGNMLKMKFEVSDGPSRDRTFYYNFNYHNKSAKAVEIALKDLKKLVMACGYDGNSDITETVLEGIKGKVFVGRLRVEKSKDDRYSDSNGFKELYSLAEYGEGMKNGTIKGQTPDAKGPGSSGSLAPPKETQEQSSAPSAPPPLDDVSEPPPPPSATSEEPVQAAETSGDTPTWAK